MPTPNTKETTMHVGIRQEASNFVRVDIGALTLWFSYQTPIAFHMDGAVRVVSDNVWSSTTGKHLNMISDKPDRIGNLEFTKLLDVALASLDSVK